MTLTRSILWTNPGGAVSVAKPGESARLPDESDDDFLARMAARLVPQGLTPRIVADADVTADVDLIAHQAAAAAAEAARQRVNAVAVLTESSERGRRERAVAILLKNRLNVFSRWTRDLKNATAAAGTLAQFKTAVAALPTLNDINLPQVLEAMRDAIDSVEAD